MNHGTMFDGLYFNTKIEYTLHTKYTHSSSSQHQRFQYSRNINRSKLQFLFQFQIFGHE